jgi:hypothetical protein
MMKRAFPILLLLAGCISARQWTTLKAHAAETALATTGGVAAVAVGGGVGVAVALAGMGVAAFVGELQKPPPDVIEAKTDANGKTTYTYHETAASKESAGYLPTFNLGILKWLVLIVAGWMGLKFIFGPRYREILGGLFVSAMRGQFKQALVKWWQSTGASHSRP